MKKEPIVRMALVLLVIVAVLFIGEACMGHEVVEGQQSLVAVVPEIKHVEIETEIEVVTEDAEEATDKVYTEPEEEFEEETVYEEEDVYEPSKEPTEEPEEDIEEEHECCNFGEEVYTEELGWPCYVHECIDCGETEFFEIEEDEEEPEEDTEHECSEFSELDDSGSFYCLECGQEFCFDD